MKYLRLIAVVCIFQSIDSSVACYGYNISIAHYECGTKNNIKFENGAYFEVTDDCHVVGNAYVTMERNVTSAVVSYKGMANSVDFIIVKNQDLCQAMLDFNVVGVPCLPFKGRARVAFGPNMDFSKYGPFLEFFAGKFTGLVKIYYDGNMKNPDLFAVTATIKLKATAPAGN